MEKDTEGTPVNRIVAIGDEQYVIPALGDGEPRKITSEEAAAFLNRSGLGGAIAEVSVIGDPKGPQAEAEE